MTTEPFLLVNDGSNEIGLKKINAASTHIFDVNRNKKVEHKFCDVCVTTGEDSSKASSLFSDINKTLTKYGIDLDNIVSIGLDNTNVNMGSQNSKSRIIENNASVFIAESSCHLAHLTGGRGGLGYKNVTNFVVEDHQVDLYYLFKNSNRHKGILLEYTEFISQEWETNW